MKITLPNDLIEIMKILENSNEEVYLVGGFVRDMIMHKPSHDYDLTTSAHPDKMIELFQSHGYSLILIGKKHGTIVVQTKNNNIEITTYREETSYTNHRSPNKILFTDSIFKDLKRRDFTINAMAYHPVSGIIDPFQGQKDIHFKVIKAVGDPFLRLQEDALRILRAIRFSCCLSFQIETHTSQAILQHAHLLTYISKERIQEEFYKILISPKQNLLLFLYTYQVLPYLFPSIIYNLTYHELKEIDHLLNKSIHHIFFIRFATILYGLLPYNTFDNIIQFLQKMKYSNKTIQHIKSLLLSSNYKIHTTSDLRKLLFSNNNNFIIVEHIIHFQYIVHTICLEEYRNLLQIFETIKENNDIFYKSDLAINGQDLLNFGFHGKQIRNILNILYELVLKNPSLNNRQYLLSYILKYLK